MLKIKGHEIEDIAITAAFNRRALQFKNNLVALLRSVGAESYVEVPLERVAITKAKASVTWYLSGQRMHYSYSLQGRFVDNLYVIYKLLEIEVNLVRSGKKTAEEFISEFREDADVEDKRKEARELLGLEPDTVDMGVINKRYKQMAKECHPDMPNGDTEAFKRLNNAHKTLQRELA